MTMSTRKWHSPEQVVRKLAQADRMLGERKDVADVCESSPPNSLPRTTHRSDDGWAQADYAAARTH